MIAVFNFLDYILCGTLIHLVTVGDNYRNDMTKASTVYNFLPSPCWMSLTPTAQPTARQHNSIKKTSGSMRREFLPLWNKAGLIPNAHNSHSLIPFIRFFILLFNISWTHIHIHTKETGLLQVEIQSVGTPLLMFCFKQKLLCFWFGLLFLIFMISYC